MNHQPDDPGRPAVDVHPGEVSDGPIASYGGHDPQVSVAERAHRPSLFRKQQVVGEPAALLDGDLRELGMAVGVGGVGGHQALVADGEDVAQPLDTVEGIDPNAAAPSDKSGIEAWNRLGFDTADPDQGARRDGGAVGKDHPVVAIARDFCARCHLDPHAAQKRLGVARCRSGHAGQQAISRLKQPHVHFVGRQIGVVAGQHETFHLGKGSCDFDARGAAADHHDIEQLIPLLRRCAGECPLEIGQQRIAQPHRFGYRFHRHCLQLDLLHPEEIAGGTGGQHQQVVTDLADGGAEQVARGEDFEDFGHAEIALPPLPEEAAEGERNRTGLHAGRGDLVDQGRELVKVVAVD